MASTKKIGAKAGKSAAKAHQARARSSSPEAGPVTPAQGAAAARGAAAKKKNVPKEWNFTHYPPNTEQRAKNGRVEGRNLITWSRPRMAEKLLLHLQYECTRYQVEVPWDSIAHRLHPGSTGGAILQHLNRLRGNLIAEGHLVPPIAQKPGSKVRVDPAIRGYVRKHTDKEDLTTVRPVYYNEPVEDRKFNLPDAYENYKPPGSRAGASYNEAAEIEDDSDTDNEPEPVADSENEDEKAVAPVPETVARSQRKSTTATTTAPKRRMGRPPKAVKKEESPAHNFLDDTDSDYDPTTKRPSKVARRSLDAKSSRSYVKSEDENGDEGQSHVEAPIQKNAESVRKQLRGRKPRASAGPSTSANTSRSNNAKRNRDVAEDSFENSPSAPTTPVNFDGPRDTGASPDADISPPGSPSVPTARPAPTATTAQPHDGYPVGMNNLFANPYLANMYYAGPDYYHAMMAGGAHPFGHVPGHNNDDSANDEGDDVELPGYPASYPGPTGAGLLDAVRSPSSPGRHSSPEAGRSTTAVDEPARRATTYHDSVAHSGDKNCNRHGVDNEDRQFDFSDLPNTAVSDWEEGIEDEMEDEN